LGGVEARIGKESKLVAPERQFLDFCWVFSSADVSYFHHIISHLWEMPWEKVTTVYNLAYRKLPTNSLKNFAYYSCKSGRCSSFRHFLSIFSLL